MTVLKPNTGSIHDFANLTQGEIRNLVKDTNCKTLGELKMKHKPVREQDTIMVGEHQKPPEGYRLLRPGEITQLEDMFWSSHDHMWKKSKLIPGRLIGDDGFVIEAVNIKLYCRKIDKPEIERTHEWGSW